MAPYMMYVACMALTLMYPLLKNSKEARSGFECWLSKASIMCIVATIQAIIMLCLYLSCCLLFLAFFLFFVYQYKSKRSISRIEKEFD